MRVVITSDTHYRPMWHAALAKMIAEIAALEPDCLIVAGDVGEGIAGFVGMLTLLQPVRCPHLILPGNHDLWARDDIPSAQLFSETLPDLARKHGAIWLETQNWQADGVAICGTLGWYDYTGRDPAIAMTADDYLRDKRLYVRDGDLIDWEWSDIAFADRIGTAFAARLAELEREATVRNIVVVTHVPPFEALIVRYPSHFGWNVRNAYFYNLTLGQRITAASKVRCVISGHTHQGRQALIPSGNGWIDARVISADYGHPAYIMLDM